MATAIETVTPTTPRCTPGLFAAEGGSKPGQGNDPMNDKPIEGGAPSTPSEPSSESLLDEGGSGGDQGGGTKTPPEKSIRGE